MYEIKLASASPRRHQLLKEAGVEFQIVSVNVSEFPDKNLNAKEQILDIARRKARAGMDALLKSDSTFRPPFVVVGADTEVIFGGGPLGKPADGMEATKVLRLLSNQTHTVLTAICFIESTEQNEWSHVETTAVTFRKLSEEEIAEYIATGDPFDKAGSYGIQSELSRKFIHSMQGQLDNVMGLPVAQFLDLYASANSFLKQKSL